MSVVNSIEDVGPWRKRLEIEVPAEAVDAELDRVIREYGRQVKVPGFRKGKVPASIVEQRYREDVEREVAERLVPKYWHEAREETAIEPMLSPSVGDVEMRRGQALVFEATVEVKPEFELGDIENFELPEADVEATEAEIDDAVERLRQQVAPWAEVERLSVTGDLVKARIVELDAEGEPAGEAQEIDVEVGSEQVWDELSLALTGVEAGRETEFRREEEHGDHSHERRFQVEALSVSEKDLPEVDDELAKSIGDFEDLAALRAQIAERLGQEKDRALASRREEAVLEQLRARHPLELPEGVVQEETRNMLGEYAQSLRGQGIDVDKVNLDWNRMAEEVQPQARERVHTRLLLDAVSEARAVTVAPEDVEERIAMLARAQNQSAGQLRRALASSGRLVGLELQMKREKTLLALLGDDKVDETVGEPAGESEEE